MNVHDFVHHLMLSKVFTSKQAVVIDNVFIYFDDLKVYKVVLQINPSMMKKAKRIGLNNTYQTIYFDGPSLMKLKFDEDNKDDVAKGRFYCVYNLHTRTANVYNGEETEKQQLMNLLK